MRAYCHFACGKVFTITGSGVTRIRQHMTRMERGGEVSFCTSIGAAELAEGISLGIPGFKAKRDWLLNRDGTEQAAPKRRKTFASFEELETLLQACKDLGFCLWLFVVVARKQCDREARGHFLGRSTLGASRGARHAHSQQSLGQGFSA